MRCYEFFKDGGCPGEECPAYEKENCRTITRTPCYLHGVKIDWCTDCEYRIKFLNKINSLEGKIVELTK